MLSTKLTVTIVMGAALMVLATSVLHLENGINYFIVSSAAYDLMRAGALVVMLMILVTTPPRSAAMRTFLGLAGASLHIWSVAMLLQYQMQLFDGALFMAIAIIFEITALEPETAPRHESLTLLRD